jgi:hypothetical protein
MVEVWFGGKPMAMTVLYQEKVECRQCNKPFLQANPWQQFCCQRHQQDWHLHQRKLARLQQAVEEAEDRRETRINGGDCGTSEQRQKASEEARMVIDQMVARAGPRLLRRL